MWRSGNLEINGRQYIWEILLHEHPVRLGLYGGRILELYLYDEDGQVITKYDREWIIGHDQNADAHEAVKIIAKEHNFMKKRMAA